MVCALGHAYGPQPERGVFRTTYGGKNREKALFVDENTGCSDLAMDPNNSHILFAGMCQLEMHTWGRTSGGLGSGLFKSTDDGGENWQLVNSDRQIRGRTHYYTRPEIAPDNENEVYFFSAAFSRTLDGGHTLAASAAERALAARARSRAACGIQWPGAKVASLRPIRWTTTSSGQVAPRQAARDTANPSN